MEIGEEQEMLKEQLMASQQSFNKGMEKDEKGSKTTKVLQKELKLSKAAREAADQR